MRVAQGLMAARCRHFVGRDDERNLFLDTLARVNEGALVLYIYGPPGIGKSALLNELCCECQSTGIPVLSVDARFLEPSANGFLSALRQSAMDQGVADLFAEPTTGAGRRVIFIDSYELLAPLDNWLRTDFFPQWRSMLIVMAGQSPLAAEWRTDLGWQGLVRSTRLTDLSNEESRAYLYAQRIPADQHEQIIAFTHGHPLALSLITDAFTQRPDMVFEPETSPDVIKVLLDRFLQKIAGPAQRAAVEACSLVRWMTEALLADILALPDPHEVFDWLRGLSFMSSGPFGLYPHELVRETLVADLRWRNPDRLTQFNERATRYYFTHLQQGSGSLQQMLDYLYLHRHSPRVGPYLNWHGTSTVFRDTLQNSDRPALLAMVEEYEGSRSAALAATWLDRQPHGAVVVRNVQKRPVGYLHVLALDQTNAGERELDPAVCAAWDYLEQHYPLRPGEQATLLRFWMDGDNYQTVSQVQSLIFATVLLDYLTSHGLAFTFFPCAQPDFWEPLLTYIGLTRLVEADFEVEGRPYGVYGHDWRAIPAQLWFSSLAAKGRTSVEPATMAAATEQLAVLSQAEFTLAVRRAFQSCMSAYSLRDSPLLHSRLVSERAGANANHAERVAVLQSILHEAAQSLSASPRGDKLYRALQVHYLHPDLTQEQAAEALDVPFSTFRRHVQMGLTRVAEMLWQQEINGAK